MEFFTCEYIFFDPDRTHAINIQMSILLRSELFQLKTPVSVSSIIYNMMHRLRIIYVISRSEALIAILYVINKDTKIKFVFNNELIRDFILVFEIV